MSPINFLPLSLQCTPSEPEAVTIDVQVCQHVQPAVLKVTFACKERALLTVL
jgi:hypothetical protein